MNFLRTKSEQLAEYLRDHIRRRELAEPLPGTRLWSTRLGVSRRTLKAAIQQLRREGLLIVTRRGIRLNPHMTLPDASTEGTRFVRFLVYGLGSPQTHQHLELLDLLHERLQMHNIQVTTEKCIPLRLREIAQERRGQNELLILASLSPLYQRIFARSGRAALIVGQPARGVPLASVTADQRGTIHHATQHLLRRGFERVDLVFADVAAPGTSQAISAFHDACNQWPRQPIVGQLVPTKLDDQSMTTTVRRFVARVKGRHGVVVVAPVPVGLIMTALLQRGLAVPREAEIIAVFHSRSEVRLDPPLAGGAPDVIHPIREVKNPSGTFLVAHALELATWSPVHFDQMFDPGFYMHPPLGGSGLNFYFVDEHMEFIPYKGPLLSRWSQWRVNPDASWVCGYLTIYGP